MTPGMIAALTSKRKSVTGFFELDLPSGTKRLLIGSGEASYGGNIFKGYDSSIGSIVGGDTVREDASSQAPNTTLTVQVAGSATKSDIAGAGVQLSPVKISLAALGLDGGNHVIAIPDPELLFDGFIDQAVSNLDKQKDEVTYTIISAFDYFFEDSEGQRLNDQLQKSLYAGELGLSNVTGVTRKIYWGTLGPNAASGVTSGVIGGTSGTPPQGVYYCVTADTPILMADGSEKPAGDLRVGDMLRTRHEQTLEWGDYPVAAFATATKPVLRAVVEGRELRATAAHRVHARGRWITMSELGTPDGEALIVKLTVEDAHTYVSNGILSHNIKSELP